MNHDRLASRWRSSTSRSESAATIARSCSSGSTGCPVLSSRGGKTLHQAQGDLVIGPLGRCPADCRARRGDDCSSRYSRKRRWRRAPPARATGREPTLCGGCSRAPSTGPSHRGTPFKRIGRCSDKHRPGLRGRPGSGRRSASVRLRRASGGGDRANVHSDSNGHKYRLARPCHVSNGKKDRSPPCGATWRASSPRAQRGWTDLPSRGAWVSESPRSMGV